MWSRYFPRQPALDEELGAEQKGDVAGVCNVAYVGDLVIPKIVSREKIKIYTVMACYSPLRVISKLYLSAWDWKNIESQLDFF